MQTYYPGLPGVTTEITAEPRIVFLTAEGVRYLPAGKVIDGASSRDPLNTGDLDCLRAGLLMGKITSGGQYAPSILGVLSAAEAAGSTTINVSAATAVELNRRIGASGTFKLIGPGSANGVMQEETVTYSAASGTDITVTAITNNFVAGSFICPTDGSEYPKTFIPDGFPIKVTDNSGANIDVAFPKVPLAGIVDSSQIINWPSDTALQAWIMDHMPLMTWDHEF